MASQIIAFIVGHWEDILITSVLGVAILLLDYFVLRKRRTDSKTSYALIATDRLIVVVLIMFFIGFYLISQSVINSNNTSFNTMYFTILFIILLYLIPQRDSKPRSKESVKGVVKPPINGEDSEAKPPK